MPIKVFTFCLLCCFLIIHACKKDRSENSNAAHQSVTELKSWFISTKTQLAGNELLIGLNPIWETGVLKENKKEIIYEVSLENANNIFTTRKDIDVKQAADYSKLSLFKLVLIKNKSTDSIRSAYMNIVAENAYNINLNNIHYQDVANFTGVVQYYNLDGSSNTGWHYINGKIDVNFTPVIYDDLKPITEAVCGSAPVYQTICGGPNSDTHSCYTTQIGGGYYQCNKSLQPDDGGGGGFSGDGSGGLGVGRRPPIVDDPSKAEHQLKKDKLPPNNTTDKQVLNTCVFKTMEWINKYFGGNKDINIIVNKYAEATKSQDQSTGTKSFLLMTDGVPGNELDGLVSMFFETTPTESIKKSIDSGYPLMGTITTDDAKIGHEVMITGYNNNGSIQYFDPQTGKYNTKSPAEFSSLKTIKGNK